ncbi:hypothetical protein NM688_g8763 [Phlebia brevispora]|uniref:Uncharacterized protein n=1 Tax=Phlebia brevispora TaxID=194682 RepID=A0ACC1RRT9_9APHY|nr:hypothetical protein NM688_g8763 [Phlebia brevispora]
MSPLLASTLRTVSRAPRLTLRGVRWQHPDGHNPVPFNFHNKSAFRAKYIAFLAVPFSVPFIASYWQFTAKARYDEEHGFFSDASSRMPNMETCPRYGEHPAGRPFLRMGTPGGWTNAISGLDRFFLWGSPIWVDGLSMDSSLSSLDTSVSSFFNTVRARKSIRCRRQDPSPSMRNVVPGINILVWTRGWMDVSYFFLKLLVDGDLESKAREDSISRLTTSR